MRLLDVYLEPLQQENILSSEEVTPTAHRPPSRHSATRRRLSDRVSLRHQVEALFGSLPEMLDFQKVFLRTLEERVASCPDLGSLETPGQLQVSAGSAPTPLASARAADSAHHQANRSLSLLPGAALLAGRLLPGLRRPLQALQRLLRQPHQGAEGPGER